MINPVGPLPHHPPQPSRDKALFRAAQELEVNFLSEMLKAAGLGKTSETFGGGAGEDQFASFLRRAQAEHIVAAGGLGMTRHLFDALKKDTSHDA